MRKTPSTSFIVLAVHCLLVCGTTNLQLSKSEQISVIKDAFLQTFGLDEKKDRPKDGFSHNSVPDYLWDIYYDNEDGEFDVLKHISPTKISIENSKWIINYDIILSPSEHIIHVHLKVNTSRLKPGRLVVASRDQEEIEVMLTENHNGWQDIDISSVPLSREKAMNMLTLTLKLDHQGDGNGTNGWRLPVLTSDDIGLIIFLENTPPLDKSSKKDYGRSEEQRTTRRKRSNDNNDGEARDLKSAKRKHNHKKMGRKTLCHREDLMVDFKELHWNDWILAPEIYNAFQCRGICPNTSTSKLNVTNHAIVQSLIHSINPSSVPAPCCIPQQLSSLQILYVDANKQVVIKNYAEMIVESCGCH